MCGGDFLRVRQTKHLIHSGGGGGVDIKWNGPMRYTTSWVRPSLPTEVEFAVGCRQVQDKTQNEVSPDWYGKQVDINCSLICHLCIKTKRST